MKIDLGDFLSSQKSVFPVDLRFSPEDGADSTGMIPDSVKIAKDGIAVSGEIRSVGSYLSLGSEVTVVYETFCDRCLAPVEKEIVFRFDRQIVAASSRGGDDDDSLPVEDGKIDLDAPLSEAIALELPSLNLCREDCPGLCPVCGKPRSDPTCVCAEKKEIDPRLAILKKLLDNSEEV
ncbi:MAG: DUF177 domain-containing protein [Clostridia bacterium]|nr:DUF177 domain-containing protein [Clostridia bacterium]